MSIAILLVVIGEFFLLYAVYHRGSDVQAQLRAQSHVVGELDQLGRTWAKTTLSGEQAVAASQEAVAELSALGVPAEQLAATVRAVDVLAAAPTDGAAFGVVRQEVSDLGADLRSRRATIENQASLILVAMLLAASVGWYIYIQRLIRRHRALQHALTAEQTNALARQELADQLARKAFRDDLTGLATRQLFGDRLEQVLCESGTHMVVVCDLDDFKNVNDSMGHGAGDRLLTLIGQRVAATVGAGDTAARLGGDEFAVLLPHAALADAEGLAERLQRSLAEPLVLDEVTWTVQGSFGIAEAVGRRDGHEQVLRNADVAMYWAKDRGKAAVATYDAALHAEALDRLSLRKDLVRALDEDQFVLHYQPTYGLEGGRLTGFEALVRWQHPTRGLLPPLRFVPLAEQTGLIVPLGRWVLREACRAATVLGQNAGSPTIAVNISAQQLALDSFVDDVLEVLAETGLAPHRLTLEITESVVIQDSAKARPRLEALRALGVKVAIDDFGTGYSSLSVLADLPVDIVKIDKSFVDRVVDDAHAASVTEAVLVMTHKLAMTTVAEGVESAAQVAWLRTMHCGVGQGFLWSRPVPLDDARALVTTLPRQRHHAAIVVPELTAS